MRRVRYNVAASLDGFIADRAGGYDWIPHDPTVDFAALFARVDTMVMGRRSYQAAMKAGGIPAAPGTRIYVCSQTLDPAEHPRVTIVARDAATTVAALRAESGDGEIWLFGGSGLFGELVAAGLVDSVEVTVVPVLLGGGVPLVAGLTARVPLTLTGTRQYPSGMVTLTYTPAVSG